MICMESDDFRLGYLAGILEGEGCFRSHRGRGGKSHSPVISLGMTDLDTVRKVAQMLDIEKISFYDPNKYGKFKKEAKLMHTIELRGIRAIEVMKSVYPYMSERRKGKIKQVIAEFKKQKKYMVDGKYVYN